MNLKLFSDKLIALQKMHNISLRTLAKEIGVSNTLLNYYVNMKRNPSDKVIEKIATYFNVPKSYFEDEFDFDPFIILDYINSKIDSVIKNEMNDLLLNETFRNLIFTSMINGQELPPLVDAPMNRLFFLFLSFKYAEKINEGFLNRKEEDNFPALLTDYSYTDIQRIFNLLGNVSQYGLKAMIQYGESVLDYESSIIENKKIPIQVQNKIVQSIKDDIRFSLKLNEYSSDLLSDDKIKINMFSASEHICEILSNDLNINLSNESKIEIKEKLVSIFQKELDNGNLKQDL